MSQAKMRQESGRAQVLGGQRELRVDFTSLASRKTRDAEKKIAQAGGLLRLEFVPKEVSSAPRRTNPLTKTGVGGIEHASPRPASIRNGN